MSGISNDESDPVLVPGLTSAERLLVDKALVGSLDETALSKIVMRMAEVAVVTGDKKIRSDLAKIGGVPVDDVVAYEKAITADLQDGTDYTATLRVVRAARRHLASGKEAQAVALFACVGFYPISLAEKFFDPASITTLDPLYDTRQFAMTSHNASDLRYGNGG